jgi:hypothetical protein
MVKFKAMKKKTVFLLLASMCTALLLSGCFGPKTPQDVAKAFWHAVIDNDAHGVVTYSTLSQPQDYDEFSLDWKGFTPSWGKVIIDGDEASIVTEFSRASGSKNDNRKCITYLVRKNDVWKVDYTMTGNALRGGPLGSLFGKLNQLGNELSKNIDASVQELNVEMERLSRQFKEMTDSFAQQASKIIDEHAQELQNIMRELEESINRALQDRDNQLSDKDRQVMTEVAADLDASSKSLSNPSTVSVTASNKNMGRAQLRLDSINRGLSDDYKERWQALGRQFEQVMRTMLDELAMSEKRNNNPH